MTGGEGTETNEVFINGHAKCIAWFPSFSCCKNKGGVISITQAELKEGQNENARNKFSKWTNLVRKFLDDGCIVKLMNEYEWEKKH